MIDPSKREVAIFSAALRLPAEERTAYLDDACAGDAALRQGLEELLRASGEADTFVEAAAPEAKSSADWITSLDSLEDSGLRG